MVMVTSHLRYLLIAASAAAAGLLVACGSPHAQTSSPGTSSSRAPAVRPPPMTATGLVSAPPGLTDRLVLRETHVTAGTVIQGELIVTYRGRKPINLNRGCRPQYAVVVTNHRVPPHVGFTAACGMAPFVIEPGENRLAVTVATTYLACTHDAWQATSSLPACLRGQQLMPSLPAGHYEAVLVGDGLPLPAPAPVPVSLSVAS
jgi:hypothetical protein